MIPSWLLLFSLGAVGLVVLVVGIWAYRRDSDEGGRRVATGIGLLGGALVMAIIKAIDGYARLRGWW